MAYTTINKASDYFNTLLWTGNSGNQSITGNSFTADFTWSKTRSHAETHILMDTVRDAGTTLNQNISSNTSNAEGTLNNSSTLTVNSTGFDVAGTTGGPLNYTGYTYASWLWRAGGHTGTSNSDGSITSTVSANTTSGFSIVKFTATGSAATVGHGLSTAPKMILVKRTDSAHTWQIYHASIGATKYLEFGAQAEQTSSGRWNDTAPTTSVFSIGTEWGSGAVLIAYCFSDITGFSKTGLYEGNGDADGAFVYTGFKPAFIMYKGKGQATDWFIFDNKRNGYNVNNDDLEPSNTSVESNTDKLDILSNGFKFRKTDADSNGSGQGFVYLAFAAAPIVGTNNIPATAR